MKRGVLTLGCVGGAIALLNCLPVAYAGDWQHEARVSVQASHESNPQLSSNARRKVTVGQLAPTWVSVYSAPTFGASVSAGTTFVRSSDQVVEPDTTRYDLQTGANADFDPVRINGNLNYFRRAFDNTEFNDNELTTDSESASVTEDVTVDDVTFSSQVQYDLSNTTNAFANNTYRIVKFSGGGSTDFMNNALLTGVNRAVSETLSISPALGYTRFEPENSDPTNLYRAQITADHQYSDSIVYSITVGALKSAKETNISLNATYQQDFEFYRFDASASRDLSPSDDGELRDEKSLQAGLAHDLTEDISVRVDAELRLNDDIESRRAGFNITQDLSEDARMGLTFNFVRSYRDVATGEQVTTALRADPFISWLLAEDVRARLSYREIQQDVTGESTARTRRVLLSINYSTPFD